MNNDGNPIPSGVHWGTYSATTELPGTSSGVATSTLKQGDVAAVSGSSGGTIYVCSSISSAGVATWAELLNDGGTIATLNTSGAAIIGGSLTATGGVAAASMPTRVFNLQPGGTAIASIGTDAVAVAGTVYVSEIFLPANKTITGIGVLNGTNVGTDDLIVALYSSAGALLGNSDLAGTLGAGADAYQQIALTTPYAAVGPARYWIGLQVEGTNHANQRMSANTPLCFTAAIAGVFGTLAAITPPTSFTAGQGPIAYVYT